ncbi:MAG: hypothetical protein QG670_2179 [Thermoproteota archaeon]|nr:hypothetical protein [Thermoproteota archaeon]
MEIVREKAEQTVKELSDIIQDDVGAQIKIFAEKVKNYSRDNPAKVLLGGVILGLIVGAIIPRTITIKIEDKKKTV